MTFHNSQCAVLARGLILKERLNEEREKVKQIREKAKKRKSLRQLSASLTSPRKKFDSSGAYSSSILCGITSEQVKISFTSHSNLEPKEKKATSDTFSRESGSGRIQFDDEWEMKNLHNCIQQNRLPGQNDTRHNSKISTLSRTRKFNPQSSKNEDPLSSSSTSTSGRGLSPIIEADDSIEIEEVNGVSYNDELDSNADDMKNITNDTGVAASNHNCHIVDIDNYPGINIQANDVIKRMPTSKSCLIEISQENQMESIIVHSKREIRFIKLAHIISESNALVGMYDKIIKLAKDLDEDDLNRTISFKN